MRARLAAALGATIITCGVLAVMGALAAALYVLAISASYWVVVGGTLALVAVLLWPACFRDLGRRVPR